MSVGKMHVDEVDTNVSLVVRLLAAQLPQWATFPSGDPLRWHRQRALSARRRHGRATARIHNATWQVHKECEWLPGLAPRLPLAVPVPLAKGEPGEGYPWHWSVYQWLEGENATIERIADPRQADTDLAQFIAALQRIDATGGPPPGPHNFSRGEPLAMRDTRTRDAIVTLQGTLDANALDEALEELERRAAAGRVVP
jgi:aminoglycoside phosphotransferase (APT) family kinase protein